MRAYYLSVKAKITGKSTASRVKTRQNKALTKKMKGGDKMQMYPNTSGYLIVKITFIVLMFYKK